MATITHLQAGDKAPNFKGITDREETVSLKDYKGKKLILFFYPKDNTPGCTAAACDLRDNYKELQEAGFELLGVSPDSVAKHQKFVAKFEFPFPLLADEEKTMLNDYGCWGPKQFMGKKFDGVLRTTFLINEKGIIDEVFTKVKTKTHAQQIMDTLG